MSHKNITILGGGLAGLSAAWHLQQEGIASHVFEKEKEVGGLCRSKKIARFTFDYDGHLLHFRHKHMLDLVQKLLNQNLVRHKRNSWVYCHDRYIRYPFQANFYGLPANVVKECLSGFIEARNKPVRPPNGNFLKWIESAFGKGIARHFMVPYNSKFWTVSPERMTCEWLHGFVPQPTLGRVIEGAVHDCRQLLGYNSHFWYPREGGIGELVNAFAQQLRHIHTGYSVEKIDTQRKVLVFGNGEERKYDELVTTIPLPEMSRLIVDLPREVAQALKKLRWNSILNVNLGFRQRTPSQKHWVYFPQKDLIFFRVGFFHNFSHNVTPAGASSLYAEVSYAPHKKQNTTKMIRRVKKDLMALGYIDSPDAVLCEDINDIYYGYPIYDRNYSDARKAVLDYLNQQQIHACGRYGSWRYMSMEDVLIDGRETARMIQDGLS